MAAKIIGLNAITFHSFCGLYDGRYTAQQIIHKLNNDPSMRQTRQRILETDVLILDEVSMTSNSIISTGEAVIRGIRNSDKYFGGIQVRERPFFCTVF